VQLKKMRFRKPVVINSVLAVAVVGTLVGTYFSVFPVSNPSSAAAQLTSTVQQGVVSKTITASGSVAPVAEQTSSFAVAGSIASVNISLGQTVTAGQLLGTLQTAPLQQIVNNDSTLSSQAHSQYTNASAELAAVQAASVNVNSTEAQSLSSTNSAEQQVATALDQVTTNSQNLARDEANLANATLLSPMAGVVIALNGSVGQTVGSGSSSSSSVSSSSVSSSSVSASAGAASTSGTSSSSSGSGFATIADISTMTVSASIAEADIASVTIGQKANVTFPAVPGQTADATVTAIAPTATASNSVVTYATTITLASVPTGLRIGQTAAVAITTKSSAADALYVPAAAIFTKNGVSTVKVVGSNGTVIPVTVSLGIAGTAGTQILTGLKAGQTVSLGVVAPTTGGTAGSGRTGFGGGTGGFGGRNGSGNGGSGGSGNAVNRNGN
jgi:macrolide-specific efflux system membrane fusion protein